MNIYVHLNISERNDKKSIFGARYVRVVQNFQCMTEYDSAGSPIFWPQFHHEAMH